MTNITAFTNRPVIITDEETTTDDNNPGVSGDPASGEIMILNEQSRTDWKTFDFTNEVTTFDLHLYLDAQTAKTTVQEYMEEIRRIVRVNNYTQSRTYYMRYNVSRAVYTEFGIVTMSFELTEYNVKVT